MSPGARSVREYIQELERSKGGREPQVKEGLEIYLGLWKKAIENGTVSETDDVDAALAKIEAKGGLYKVAEG